MLQYCTTPAPLVWIDSSVFMNTVKVPFYFIAGYWCEVWWWCYQNWSWPGGDVWRRRDHSEYFRKGSCVGEWMDYYSACPMCGESILLYFYRPAETFSSVLYDTHSQQITNHQVDKFVPDCRLPSCKLCMKWTGQPVQLKHRIEQLQAFNFFLIWLPKLPSPLPPPQQGLWATCHSPPFQAKFIIVTVQLE